MKLLLKTIRLEIKTLNKNNIRLKAIGNLSQLPKATLDELNYAIDATAKNDRMDLVLALNYSGKSELTNATKTIAQKIKNGDLNLDDINEDLISNHLYTKDLPDPELMIRSSGENRLSNFLLWQLAYAEFYFTPVLWPDFSKEELYRAILSYQQRERRFGKTSDQLSESITPNS
jgi:undecaprenyl diphosphate synthase